MNVIYKYPLVAATLQDIEMPIGTQVLSVQGQKNQICVWALVDTLQSEKKKVSFRVLSTGHEFYKHPGKFLGTVQKFDGELKGDGV